jgi:hypothetical protein
MAQELELPATENTYIGVDDQAVPLQLTQGLAKMDLVLLH